MKAIIIGAASGIGRELAIHLSNNGYTLGLGDVDFIKLQQLSILLKTDFVLSKIDVCQPTEARALLTKMIIELKGVDIFIYTAGVKDKTHQWENEYHLYNVNAIGFASLASLVFDYFKTNAVKGKIAGITSVLAVRGLKQACSYCASKAFMHTYMDGLRHRSVSENLGISITEVRPGFVITPMTEKQEGMFWITTPQKAAKDIRLAIEQKTKLIYVRSRWKIVALFLKWIPDTILHAKLLQLKRY